MSAPRDPICRDGGTQGGCYMFAPGPLQDECRKACRLLTARPRRASPPGTLDLAGRLGRAVAAGRIRSFSDGTPGGAYYVVVAVEPGRVCQLMDLAAAWAIEDGGVPTSPKYRPVHPEPPCTPPAESPATTKEEG